MLNNFKQKPKAFSAYFILIRIMFNSNIFYNIQLMQETRREQQHFHEQTDTFSLDVTLKDGKLTVILKDFIEWAIYEKEYSEQDVGKEVHNKIDLNDVYASFIHLDKTQEKEKTEGNISRLNHYKFGTVVEYKGIPCYKVQREGKITSYFTIIDKKENKQIVYESKLILAKVRNLTDQQIYYQMSLLERKDAFEQLAKYIEKQKNNKSAMLTKIQLLEKESDQLKNQLKVTKLTLSAKAEKKGSKQESLRQQLAISAIKESIEDSCRLQGFELFQKIFTNFQKIDIRLEDILKLSIPEAQAEKQKFPLQIYLPTPIDSLSGSQIKNLLIGSLMYPLELLPPQADPGFVQSYKNVPIQQIICAELGNPQAIDTLRFLTQQYASSSKTDEDHEFYQLMDVYKDKIGNLFYDSFYLPRQNDAESCFTSEIHVFDFGLEPNLFLYRLCQIKEEFDRKYGQFFNSK